MTFRKSQHQSNSISGGRRHEQEHEREHEHEQQHELASSESSVLMTGVTPSSSASGSAQEQQHLMRSEESRPRGRGGVIGAGIIKSSSRSRAARHAPPPHQSHQSQHAPHAPHAPHAVVGATETAQRLGVLGRGRTPGLTIDERPVRSFLVRALFFHNPNLDVDIPARGHVITPGDVFLVTNANDADWWKAKRLENREVQQPPPHLQREPSAEDFLEPQFYAYGLLPSVSRIVKQHQQHQQQPPRDNLTSPANSAAAIASSSSASSNAINSNAPVTNGGGHFIKSSSASMLNTTGGGTSKTGGGQVGFQRTITVVGGTGLISEEETAENPEIHPLLMQLGGGLQTGDNTGGVFSSLRLGGGSGRFVAPPGSPHLRRTASSSSADLKRLRKLQKNMSGSTTGPSTPSTMRRGVVGGDAAGSAGELENKSGTTPEQLALARQTQAEKLYEIVEPITVDYPRPLVMFGAGKEEVLEYLISKFPNRYTLPIPHTTRAKRENEQEGVDYYFVSKEQLEEEVNQNKFIECATFRGNYYGTSLRAVVDRMQEKQRHCILEVGHTAIERLLQHGVHPITMLICHESRESSQQMIAKYRNVDYSPETAASSDDESVREFQMHIDIVKKMQQSFSQLVSVKIHPRSIEELCQQVDYEVQQMQTSRTVWVKSQTCSTQLANLLND